MIKVSKTTELAGVDILHCPLCETAKTLGVPEIADVICLIDKGQMTGFRYIDYIRDGRKHEYGTFNFSIVCKGMKCYLV